MRHRHPLPRIWLMTDERISDLEGAIARLPSRSGIVFRHYSLEQHARRALFNRVRAQARRYRHILLLADTPYRAHIWGADGAHNGSRLRSVGLRSSPVHNRSELKSAMRSKADLIFVSPVFATRSHPGSRTLGRVGLATIATRAPMPVIAMGGINAKRAKSLDRTKIYGWAAIDGLSKT